MTVKELKEKLANVPDELDITICDYSDDSDHRFHFFDADGCEVVESESKMWVSIFRDRK